MTNRPRVLAAITGIAFVALALVSCSSSAPMSGSATKEVTELSHDAGVIAVIGDFGSGSAHERAVADLVSSQHATVVVTTGDNVYAAEGYDALVGNFYRSWIDAEAFFPAVGNHDYEEGIAAFEDYFAYLKGQRDYVVTVGDVAFFILDGEQSLASLDSAHNQENWLRQAIAASPAAFRIVVVHYPPYSSSTRHGSTPDLQWDFAEMGVNLVLSGHDHTYERVDRDSVTYVVDGVGGKDLYDCGPPVEGSVVCDASDFGALFLTEDAGVLRGQFLSVSGDVVDDFTLSVTR